jgi:hypothetical protein
MDFQKVIIYKYTRANNMLHLTGIGVCRTQLISNWEDQVSMHISYLSVSFIHLKIKLFIKTKRFGKDHHFR